MPEGDIGRRTGPPIDVAGPQQRARRNGSFEGFFGFGAARGRAHTERCPRATYMRLVSREGPGRAVAPVRAGCGVLRAASRAERRGEQMESEVFSMRRLKGEG